MGVADDVKNELMGSATGHAAAVWRNVAGWAASPRTLQDKVTRLMREWIEEASYSYDIGRPGLGDRRDPVGPRNALYRVLHEATVWIPRRRLADLKAKRGETDTVLGHAADAASYGDVNQRILARIAAKLDVDISDLQ